MIAAHKQRGQAKNGKVSHNRRILAASCYFAYPFIYKALVLTDFYPYGLFANASNDPENPLYIALGFQAPESTAS